MLRTNGRTSERVDSNDNNGRCSASWRPPVLTSSSFFRRSVEGWSPLDVAPLLLGASNSAAAAADSAPNTASLTTTTMAGSTTPLVQPLEHFRSTSAGQRDRCAGSSSDDLTPKNKGRCGAWSCSLLISIRKFAVIAAPAYRRRPPVSYPLQCS